MTVCDSAGSPTRKARDSLAHASGFRSEITHARLDRFSAATIAFAPSAPVLRGVYRGGLMKSRRRLIFLPFLRWSFTRKEFNPKAQGRAAHPGWASDDNDTPKGFHQPNRNGADGFGGFATVAIRTPFLQCTCLYSNGDI